MSLEFLILDLDDTLYPRGSGVMEEIGQRIQIWLCRELGLTWEQAAALRREYLRDHGTTMAGLMAHQNIDIDGYLDFVHSIAVEEHLEPDPDLRAMLVRMPLRKVVYTNATSAHGRRVLSALGISDQFERVIGIEDVGLRNKVDPKAYECMLALLGATGEECVMVEDSPLNLGPAKAVSMITVLVMHDRGSEIADGMEDTIDFVVDDVLEVERVVDRLLTGGAGAAPTGDCSSS